MLTVANAATKELSRPLVPMLSVKNTEDIGAVDLGTRLGNGQDEHSAHGGDHGARGVDGLAGRHAAVLGAGQRACGGAGDHDAHDAHREVVNLVAEVHDVDAPPVRAA